ncbi:MAG: AI-2E family transporter [Pseudomonadota bacterium]
MNSRAPIDNVLMLVVRLAILAVLIWLIWLLLRPFASLLIWSAILAVALFPIHDWVRRRAVRSEVLSAVLVTIGALILVFGPVAWLCTNLILSVEHMAQAVQSGDITLPKLPAALTNLPYVSTLVGDMPALSPSRIEAYLQQHGNALVGPGRWALHMVAVLAGSVTIFAISVVAAGCLFMPGPRIARQLQQVAERVAGPQGQRFVDIATATIRNVARGVIGVSTLQAILIGTVMMVMGVPHAGLLTLAALVLSISQIGASVVVIPVLLWFWLSRDTGSALLFTALMLPIGLVDQILKPLAVGQGLEAPTAVIFLGVVGGTVAFGVTGLFLGPMLLALAYELLRYWIEETAVSGDPPVK